MQAGIHYFQVYCYIKTFKVFLNTETARELLTLGDINRCPSKIQLSEEDTEGTFEDKLFKDYQEVLKEYHGSM